jgi:hypothetical protein
MQHRSDEHVSDEHVSDEHLSDEHRSDKRRTEEHRPGDKEHSACPSACPSACMSVPTVDVCGEAIDLDVRRQCPHSNGSQSNGTQSNGTRSNGTSLLKVDVERKSKKCEQQIEARTSALDVPRRTLEAAVERMSRSTLRKHALQRMRSLEAQRVRSNKYSKTEKARDRRRKRYCRRRLEQKAPDLKVLEKPMPTPPC